MMEKICTTQILFFKAALTLTVFLLNQRQRIPLNNDVALSLGIPNDKGMSLPRPFSLRSVFERFQVGGVAP